jgi:phage protein D
MSLLGVRITLLIGPTAPVPVPPMIAEALDQVSVHHSDDNSSGCQVSFKAGRTGLLGVLDFPLMQSPLLKPLNRIIVIVTFNATPHVLFDGLITNQEVQPGQTPGTSLITITCEDATSEMDAKPKHFSHPAQGDFQVALKIIASYAQYGLIPNVKQPILSEVPSPTERIPAQHESDYQHLLRMAERHGFVFFLKPGKLPGTSEAYWGPPPRGGAPQPALTVNMGSATNVESFNVQYNALAAKTVSGRIQDRRTNLQMDVQSFASTRLPPLAALPSLLAEQPNVRHELLHMPGATLEQAFARVQALTDKSTDDVVTATGSLDASRYGRLLEPRGLVGVRGAGLSNDGLYYVKRVEHSIRKGDYRQDFTLTREGKFPTVPVVPT